MTTKKPTPYDDVIERLSPGPQSMSGFDADYTDIVDYIIRCTYKIWEERSMGLIDTHYAEDSVIHTPSGDVVGSKKVTANSIQTLSLFPDRRPFPEEVIWSGNDKDGFYTSHRLFSTAHHLGFGLYGEPSGKRLKYRVIADCVVKENLILEEWLVRDELGILRQIGLDERAFVAKLVGMNPEKYATSQSDIPAYQMPPELPASQKKGFDVEDFVKRAWHNAWNRRLFDQFTSAYSATIHCHSASGRALFGHREVIQFAIDWLSCFPDGQMRFDHFCAVGDETKGYRVAMRWTFTGTHTGNGIYGEPSGKPVKIMGISHFTVQSGRIVEEWTMFDELNVLCQLYVPEKDNNISKEDIK
jgi:predicted ester cyclase